MEHRLDEIVCNSFKVVNRDGQVVASVRADKQGNGKVVVYDRRGEPRAEVDGNGSICIYGEHGLTRVLVGMNQQGDRAVRVIGRNTECGRATPKNTPPDVDPDGQDGAGTGGSTTPPRVGSYEVQGLEGSVKNRKPIAVSDESRRFETDQETWRHLIARVSKSLDVPNPNEYTDWNANRIREEIVNLISRHSGVRPSEIVFEVYKR